MTIRFEFFGGCKGGTSIAGEDDLRLGASKNPAHRYLFLTDGGRVGARFRESLSPEAQAARDEAAFDAHDEATKTGRTLTEQQRRELDRVIRGVRVFHLYEVTHREAGPDGIMIRVDYLGEETGE